MRGRTTNRKMRERKIKGKEEGDVKIEGEIENRYILEF